MNEPTARRVTRYVTVVVRWMAINAAVVALTLCVGVYLINNVIRKVYVSSVTLELPAVDLATPSRDALQDSTDRVTAHPQDAWPLADSTETRPEFENIMMSPDFLLGIVKDLGLDKEWARRLSSDTTPLPDVDSLTRMERVVRFAVKDGSHQVTIFVQSDVPQEAADIANAIGARYKTGREAGENPAMESSAVQIIARAEVPEEPVKPDKSFDYGVTLVLAIFLGLVVSSFVEMAFLFIRARERTEG